jgi:Tfp pilus assembly protein PilF
MLAEEWLAECDRARGSECTSAARRHIEWLERYAPDAPDNILLRARLRSDEGEYGEADRLLETACHTQADPIPCLRLRASIAAKIGPEALEAVAKILVAHDSGNNERCAASHEYVGQLFDQIGAPSLALEHFSVAANRSPTAERWAHVAAAALGAGDLTLAATAYDRAARLEPNAGYTGKAAQLRATLPAPSATAP